MRGRLKIGVALVALALIGPGGLAPAFAQQAVGIYIPTGNGQPGQQQVGATNPLPVTGSISANLGAFAPAAGNSSVSLAVTSASGNVGFTTAGTVQVCNTGANTAYVGFGTSGSAAVTTSATPLLAGYCEAFNSGTNTFLAAITASSTTTLLVTPGTGLPAYGVAGSGGSSSNASVAATAGAVPGSATYLGISVGGTLTGLTAGSATSANSVPVVIASDQAAVGVKQSTASALNATVVGTGTFATQSVVTQGTAASLNATVVGAGSAGTPNAGVVTVQGATSMTKLLVTPDSVALPANQSVNLAQVNGVTTLTGAGATGTGSQRETVAQDTGTVAGSAPGTAGSPSTNVVSTQGVAGGTNLPVSQATASALNATVVPTTGTFAGCAGATEANTLTALISVTTGTQIVTGTASQKIRVCSVQLVTTTAQNIALIEGSGSVCASSPLGLFGGATAATGWNLSANGGLAFGNGQGVLAKTTVNANNICLLTSSTGQISGSITYTSF